MAEIGNRRKDLEQLLEEISKEVHGIAKEEYIAQLAKTGKQYTGSLRSNFERGLIKISSDMAAEIVFSFGQYGRWNDLKYVEYSGYDKPNNKGKSYSKDSENDADTPEAVLKFEAWIKAKGLRAFKYVQGYVKSAALPTTTRAVKRMAWGMYLGRIWKGKNVNKKTQWYAKTTPKILKKARPLVSEKVAKMLTDGTYSKMWEDLPI